MHLLAIDLGDQRTGLAAGDTETAIASPLKPLLQPLKHTATKKHGKPTFAFAEPGTPGDFTERLIAVIADHQPDAVVIGLPLNADGSESHRSRLARAYAEHLARWLKAAGRTISVRLADERHSTQRADELMAQTGLTHKQKKARRDSLAAAAVLADLLQDPEDLPSRAPEIRTPA